jgi:hypothetical protein
MFKKIVLILGFSLGLSCATIPPAPEGASCATACIRATQLKCSFAQPTDNGAICETVCKNAQQIYIWDLNCRTKATSCSAIDNCENP